MFNYYQNRLYQKVVPLVIPAVVSAGLGWGWWESSYRAVERLKPPELKEYETLKKTPPVPEFIAYSEKGFSELVPFDYWDNCLPNQKIPKNEELEKLVEKAESDRGESLCREPLVGKYLTLKTEGWEQKAKKYQLYQRLAGGIGAIGISLGSFLLMLGKLRKMGLWG